MRKVPVPVVAERPLAPSDTEALLRVLTIHLPTAQVRQLLCELACTRMALGGATLAHAVAAAKAALDARGEVLAYAHAEGKAAATSAGRKHHK